MSSEDRRLPLVLDLARQVTARHDLDDVLATTFRCLRAMLDFTGGSIQLLDDDGWIRLAATDPAAPPDVLAMRIPLGSTVGGRVILTERPVYVPDVLADAAVPPERRRAMSRGVRSYLGVPLLADGAAIGLLQVDSDRADAWPEDERLLLSTVAPIIAAAIQNARTHALQSVVQSRLRAVEACRDQLERLLDDELEPAAIALQAFAVAEQLPTVREEARRLTLALAAARRLLDPDGDDPDGATAGDDVTDRMPQQSSPGETATAG